jgi:two-component system nitrogen regulation response regulator GlnG
VPEILGQAPAMQEVFRAIGRLAHSHATVLINGESGTGKELVARALHRHSPRRDAPFIAINTAAIPRDLLESELFGHERGAFTGAATQRRGRFEQADGGTLFLDEIGDMPAELQTRLLRVLSDGHFYRVGGHQPIKANVRVIAATHQDLEGRVKPGPVPRRPVPPPQRHPPAPAAAARAARGHPAAGEALPAEERAGARRRTQAPLRGRAEVPAGLDFPGNVRQLENLCHWLTVMAPGQSVEVADLPPELREGSPAASRDLPAGLEGAGSEADRLLARAPARCSTA